MDVLQQNVHQQEKTKSLLVHGKGIPAKLDEDTPLRLDVKIDDSVIEQVSSHKILCVVIDSQMNYESHIDELRKKLSKRIGLLKHISPFQIPWWKVAVRLTYERRRKMRPNMPPKRWRQTRSQNVNGIAFCKEHWV